MSVLKIIVGIAIFSFILMVHELGHAYEMHKRGVEIEEIGYGFKIPFIPHLEFQIPGTNITGVISPVLLGGYVAPSEAGSEKVNSLPYEESIIISGRGIWINAVIGGAILLCVFIFDYKNLKTKSLSLVIGGATVVFIAFPIFSMKYLFIPLGIGTLIWMVYSIFQKKEESTFVYTILWKSRKMNFDVKKVCVYTGALSIGIALFNMVPVLPLDGGRIMEAYILVKYPEMLLGYKYASMFVFSMILMTSFYPRRK